MIGNFRSHRTVLAITAVAALAAASGQAYADITLVIDGTSQHTIVIAPDCSPSERYAAEELQTFLEQISDARLPISTEPVAGPAVFVGDSDALDALSLHLDFPALGDEGLVVKTVGQHLVLAGGRKRGTLYAVYEFLDKHLGCRWYTSGGQTPAVSRIPRQTTIVIPWLDETKIPALEYRSAWYAEAFDGDWAARNHLNGPGIGPFDY